ncbi:MAG: FliM/FliN family flagellar motor switch protein [Pseudomonadota bacterium]
MQDMSNTTSKAEPTAPAITLQLVIGAGRVGWAQFQTLDVGHVLDLDKPPEAIAVALWADGSPVGTVELVSLGDRLGARIVSMDDDD